MDDIGLKRRATVHDVARTAGVSLATVDRVLNARPGVRAQTVEKVEAAIAEIGFQRDLGASLLARARDLNFTFIIPDGSNEFMAGLADAVTRRTGPALGDRVHIVTRRIRALDADALAQSLDALDPRQCDCAIIVASDHASVRLAVDNASRRGIAVMTLVSDLPGTQRRHFIGIDNVAAGRTAASLMGRFLPQGGKVAVIAGSLHLRDHAERLEGFRVALSAEFAGIEIIGPVEGHDERSETEAILATVLAQHSDLAGLYNLGAGNAGLVAALEASGRAGQIRTIAHELTESTRMGLRSGAVDVVLDQNPDGEIREAIAAARNLALGGRDISASNPIEIGIFLRDNLR
ncbi:MAG: LacI family DNA-binding transcriptional regulator [Candidatus Devosia phytovorans]|uniref:LacI family DNA-binding transcriptional regulator n=1 Tax=Candidatus Devosia phytovorans TaxID=3121372 RepID=A0AAJ5VSQ4_9HYPH|nr:LacI family DNA-binding transcriptional regulator [Devosia sp.]WEK04123.1 MAG: LacI family DNA-binding transcriptional regulator [Devosia sp.]